MKKKTEIIKKPSIRNSLKEFRMESKNQLFPEAFIIHSLCLKIKAT